MNAPAAVIAAAEAWRVYASPLAVWVMEHLVARTDVWGGYVPIECREDGSSFTKPAVKDRGTKVLTTAVLEAHFRGEREWQIVGLHPAGADNRCRFVVIDVDHHGEPDPGAVHRNLTAALRWVTKLSALGFQPWLIDSNGRGGFHIWVIFAEPVPTDVAHAFGRWVVADYEAAGLSEAPEVNPKQRHIGPQEYGNWVRLPGRHHTHAHWSRLWDGESEWLEGAPACEHILNTVGDDILLIPDKALPVDEPEAAADAAGDVQGGSEGEGNGAEADRLSDVEVAERCLTRIPNNDVHYDDWLRVIAAAHRVDSGARMRAAAEAWSRCSGKHEQGKFDKAWDSFGRGGIAQPATLGTLVHLARRQGYDVYAERRAELRERYEAERREAGVQPTPQGAVVATAEEPLRPVPVVEFLPRYPTLREVMIEGVLRRGEVANVVAAPKMRKSWLVLALALCVAAGMHWLGRFRTRRGRVLLVDNECHPETLADRIPRVAAALGIEPADYEANFELVSLRGDLRTLDRLDAFFRSIADAGYDLIVLDALYRLLPRDCDENANADIMRVYNLLDRYAAITGAAIVVIHHSSKGVQGNKSVTDVGAGAGAQSRAADTHIVLRQHEVDDCAVMECVARSWPPLEPLAMRWQLPLWVADPLLDPTLLKRETAKGGRPRKSEQQSEAEESAAPEPWTAERFTREFVTDTPKLQDLILTRATATLSQRQAKGLLLEAQDRGLVHRHKLPNTRAVYLSTTPQSEMFEDTNKTRAHPPYPP